MSPNRIRTIRGTPVLKNIEPTGHEIHFIKVCQFKAHTALAGSNGQNQDNNFRALKLNLGLKFKFPYLPMVIMSFLY